MEVLTGPIQTFWNWFCGPPYPPPTPDPETFLADALFVMYRVLTWEEPHVSIYVFLGSLSLFWSVVYFKFQFLGMLLLLSLFLFAFYEMKEDLTLLSSRPPNPQQMEAFGKFRADLTEIYNDTQLFRRENPLWFAILVMTILLFGTVSVNWMSDYAFFFLVHVVLFSLSLVVTRWFPDCDCMERVKLFIRGIVHDQGNVIEEDQLIPMVDVTDEDDDRDEDQDSLRTDRTADSVTNSLIGSLSQMPSHIDEEVDPDLLEEDLIPSPSVPTPYEVSSDSDSENNKGMRFDSRHFNGDSSSEEEYAANMTFPSIQETVDGGDDQQPRLPSMHHYRALLSKLPGGGFLEPSSSATQQPSAAAAATSAEPPRPRNPSPPQDSSSGGSDSEFEMVGFDDVSQKQQQQ